ncbi:MAG: outer membrane beta-barrel protein, partial [Cyclobacteriaceae bacterium]|nr:outer membrane beta-barrel protein [Cyclobacteriaceae bacterium]
MKKYFIFFFLCSSTYQSFSQIINTAVMDTSDFRYQGKVTVEGYVDAYYSYDFNKPQDGNRSYFVSMNRHNEMTINLAFIDLKNSSNRMRARLVPGFGTYINANYSAENGTLKNLVEASAGLKIWADKNIWVDVGVFGSPYTNESAISKDHLAYTRSFAPEYVPYYLSGVKVSFPIADKLNGFVYLLNGWQQIGDANKNKSIGTQLEYRPGNNWLVNWNTYIGNENSATDPFVGTRY